MYLPFAVAPSDLEVAVPGLKSLGVQGFNVTIPHKQTIIPYIDIVDSSANACGAVNTIVKRGDTWVGYNTDGVGLVDAIQSKWAIPLQGAEIVIIGAGGSATGIGYALTQLGAKIALINRTDQKSIQLAVQLGGRPISLTSPDWKSAMARADIVIQTTSVGMAPHQNALPLPEMEWVQPAQKIIDIIYGPPTPFLQEAAIRGADTMTGIDMLVAQGARAFTLFTGHPAPVPIMRKAIQ